MTPNPFVEFAQDPVSVLAWLGYALAMLAVAVLGSTYSVRTLTTCYVQWTKNRHSDAWWGGYVPPAAWAAKASWAVLVLAVAAWALGALIWLAVGGGV